MLYLKKQKEKLFLTEKRLIHYQQQNVKNLDLKLLRKIDIKMGLVLDFSVEENSVLENYYTEKFAKRGFLKKNIISKFAKEICEKYDVRKAGDEKNFCA